PAATKSLSETCSLVMNPEQYMSLGVGTFPTEIFPERAACGAAGCVCCELPVFDKNRPAKASNTSPDFRILPPLQAHHRHRSIRVEHINGLPVTSTKLLFTKKIRLITEVQILSCIQCLNL